MHGMHNSVIWREGESWITKGAQPAQFPFSYEVKASACDFGLYI